MKKFIGKVLIFILLLFLTFSVFSGSNIFNLTFFEFILFSFIGIYSVISIMRELKYNNYSLNIMHWLFIFFFFFMAPVVQILFDYNVWGIYQSSSSIENSCLIIIIWILFFRIGNVAAYKNSLKQNDNKIVSCTHANSVKYSSLIFFTLLSFISTFIVVKNVGFSNLFARSSSVLSYDGAYSQMTTLITGHCTKVIILFSTFLSLIKYKSEKKGIIILTVNLIFLLLTCFPTAVARNTAGIVYMGLYAVYSFCEGKNKKKNVQYITLFIVAFVVLFPAINTFRNLKFDEVNIIETLNDVSQNVGKNYLTGDYDAFSMVGNVVDYTKKNGMSYGKQFLGGFLFMVPRNIWPTKPVGSGSMVFTSFDKSFTNVSCPLIAEGYINFGIVGVILLSFLAGYICSRIDYMYWNHLNKEEFRYSFGNLIYPVLLPSYFFMLRGDFMSTWSNLFVYVVFFYIFSKYLLIGEKKYIGDKI